MTEPCGPDEEANKEEKKKRVRVVCKTSRSGEKKPQDNIMISLLNEKVIVGVVCCR